MKKCCRCKLKKEIDEFYKNARMCKTCCREYGKQYRKNNLEKIKGFQKRWYSKNAEKERIHSKEYRRNNTEKLRKTWKQYREKNSEKQEVMRKIYCKRNRKQLNEYAVNRRKTNPIHKLSHNIRGRIRDFLRTNNILKTSKTFEIIGCSPVELKNYIEKQFTKDMTWNNYGYYGWHIDHKVPLDNGKTKEEIYKLCHYTNLQPLWWKDNLKKSNKLD